MNTGSICTRRGIVVDALPTLGQAATLMKEHQVGALVVTSKLDAAMRIDGLVTDRDLVLEVLARGLDPTACRIGKLASAELTTVSEDDDLDQAIAAVQDAGVRRLLVLDPDQGLTGIVSFDDVMIACAQQLAELAGVLGAGIDREADATAAPTPPLPPTRMRIPAMGTAGWGPEA